MVAMVTMVIGYYTNTTQLQSGNLNRFPRDRIMSASVLYRLLAGLDWYQNPYHYYYLIIKLFQQIPYQL